MASVNLLESSKQLTNTRQRAALQLYASTYQPLQAMNFVDAEAGGVLSWTVEDTLGTAGGRAIGSDFTPDNGRFKPHKAVAAIYGGKVQVDRAIRKTNPNIVPSMKANKVRGFARQFVKDVFEGQGGTSLKGISKWIADNYPGQAVNGSDAVIAMAKMDALYDKLNVVPGRSFFYMTQTPFLALNTLSRTNGTGQQNIQYQVNQFGMRVAMYNDVQIVVLKDATGTDVLSTTETTAGAHSGEDSTSIYGVTYGDDMFTGFQSGPMDFIDDSDASNFEEFAMEHIAGIAPKIPRCVARIYNVKNSLT